MDDQAFSTHEASRHSMDGRRAHDQHQPRPRPGLYSPPLAAGGRGDAAGDARAEGGRVVAVLVESLPALSCRLRDEALGDRYSAWTDARERAAVLNAEVRCISRVVVHPRWRGAGLAVRLVRAALARPTTAVTEAIAAMGAVNPFFEKAGMTPYRRPPHEADARLRAALASVGLGAESLATPDATLARIGAMPARSRAFVLRELSRWHARLHHGTHASAAATEQMAEARARLMCEPVYYVKVNDRDDRAQDDATTKTPRHQEDEDVEKFLGRHLGR